ncbi:autorepressor SdpR family transcription factor [Ethanoligenens harbinense]|uniref:Transcriptional regulator, ArsR family n=1 Tax=Ethanoligenens harbinense (strain DSM 18485 / JCM 12961 / CGMCC 1.5033 / YUAN-3) TaxID=663278 RepID=E6U2Y5_ETHHY|nr:autorepressor SdpR family transcription factor [Ethanoligenens harbinense]ADU26352.1 transcriptional regulator, ArsR family [Ethanoligenens harbinense YUAN-3]AVQ95483.1 ArsR family transcriptional regulator [Ethanoligenens harbinense YUAN-3]AYF38148.1 ArsR family transcriptional regulator [Ethanoligenens harbinense]AYF40893.1 ArsR family transcriptional regulator [Ethanoligenens harbinense]QCN91724.1 ArsR family transcriptional regulator [Ethanoligenens harbinense]
MSLNTLFKALADPTRRRIILLLQQGDLNAGEIAGHFAISKPSISRHLHILKEASLVSDERRGQNVIYSLNTTVFQDVINWLFNAANIQEKSDNHEKDPQK